MKVTLRITKNGTSIFAGAYDVVGADSFGKACADAWSKLQQERLDQESSIGALFEHINDNVLDQLNGAHMHRHDENRYPPPPARGRCRARQARRAELILCRWS